jgi:hypothetical protein
MISLALIRRSTAVPEKEPLQALILLQFVFETEFVLFVSKLEEVEQLRGRLHNWEWRRYSIINDDWDTAWVID